MTTGRARPTAARAAAEAQVDELLRVLRPTARSEARRREAVDVVGAALRLLRRSPRLRLCLLDKEHGAHPHKLWSFWSESPRDVVPLPDLPLQTWEHMEVAGADFRRREHLGRLKYATVMSEEFEARALETLRNYPGVDIISSGVRNLVDLNNRVAVHTEHEVLHAPYVFQSYRLCPPRPPFPLYEISCGLKAWGCVGYASC